MKPNFVQYNSSMERRAAFMNMVHGKDRWEERMREILNQRASLLSE